LNNSSKKLPKKSEKEDFAFEKKSKDGKKETVEELKAKNNDEEIEEDLVEEEVEVEPKPKRRAIKILSERDIQYREAPPPNFSPYFKSYLHYKNSRYKEHKKLTRNEYNY